MEQKLLEYWKKKNIYSLTQSDFLEMKHKFLVELPRRSIRDTVAAVQVN